MKNFNSGSPSVNLSVRKNFIRKLLIVVDNAENFYDPRMLLIRRYYYSYARIKRSIFDNRYNLQLKIGKQ